MISLNDLEARIAQAMEANSGDAELDPIQARQQFASALAEAVHDFVVGRTTIVTGTSATGGAVTGEGIINGDVG